MSVLLVKHPRSFAIFFSISFVITLAEKLKLCSKTKNKCFINNKSFINKVCHKSGAKCGTDVKFGLYIKCMKKYD